MELLKKTGRNAAGAGAGSIATKAGAPPPPAAAGPGPGPGPGTGGTGTGFASKFAVYVPATFSPPTFSGTNVAAVLTCTPSSFVQLTKL